MSDPFDKSASGRSATSGKQVMIAVLLGVAFMGVLAFQFRSQPRSAEANASAVGADGTATPIFNSESATKAIALLADDPTAKLLRGGVEGPNPLDEVPNNPFVLAPQWRAKLTKAPLPKPLIPTAAPRTDNGPAFDASHINVSMIVKQGAGYLAVVNGKPTNVGAIVAGAKIIEIRADRLICTQIARPTAPPFEVLMGNKPK